MQLSDPDGAASQDHSSGIGPSSVRDMQTCFLTSLSRAPAEAMGACIGIAKVYQLHLKLQI